LIYSNPILGIKMESAKEILTSRGVNPSHQRIRILEHLMQTRDHPTVTMVYGALSPEIPTLSKATVYNTLNALAEAGLATALTIKPEETRYDFKKEPHHHFLCKQCGTIIDVGVRCGYAEASEVEGHRLEEIHGYFKGTCKECLKRMQGLEGRYSRQASNTKGRKGG
jgi:Fe2+ or Zn2+ uptake regulation protein